MSVILLGDGTITSSVAITTLTLGNPGGLHPPAQPTENVDRLKSDGGVMTLYKKGRRGLVHTLRIPWLTTADMTLLLRFFEVVDSTNWFTLQDNLVYYKSAFAHEGITAQNIVIYSATAFQTAWLYTKLGLTAFCMSVVGGGGNTGERKRIVNQDILISGWSTYDVIVSPGFTNNIQVGDTFLLGLPVISASPPKIEPIKPSDAFKVELYFEEKIF